MILNQMSAEREAGRILNVLAEALNEESGYSLNEQCLSRFQRTWKQTLDMLAENILWVECWNPRGAACMANEFGLKNTGHWMINLLLTVIILAGEYESNDLKPGYWEGRIGLRLMVVADEDLEKARDAGQQGHSRDLHDLLKVAVLAHPQRTLEVLRLYGLRS
jgi:hypothetical protein